MMSRGSDDLRDATVHGPQERVVVRWLDQSAGAGAVDQCLCFFGAHPQRGGDVVRPEVRAQRRDKKGVEHGLIQPAQPLDQCELRGRHDRRCGCFAVG